MPTPLLSKEFVVLMDASVVGYATDFTFSVDKKIVDITTLSSAGWTDNMVTDKNWSIDFNGLVSRTAGDSSRGYNYFMNSILTVDTSIAGVIKPTVTGNQYWLGSGFLTGVKMQGSVGEKVTFSGSFVGSGPLSSSTA